MAPENSNLPPNEEGPAKEATPTPEPDKKEGFFRRLKNITIHEGVSFGLGAATAVVVLIGISLFRR